MIKDKKEIGIESETIEQNHKKAVRLVSHLRRLLAKVGIKSSFAGNTSILLELRKDYKRPIHDVDLIVRQSKVQDIQTILVENGFDFWNENFIYRTVRNLTGGKGRHHNYGFSSPKYLQGVEIPVWGGIFTYIEDTDSISFYEYFAISERKVRLMIANILNRFHQQGKRFLPPDLRDYFEDILRVDIISKERLGELLNLMKASGIDFWNEINSPVVNVRDIEYRDIYRNLERKYYKLADSPVAKTLQKDEHYFEFKLEEKYPISSKEYLFSQTVRLSNGGKVYIVPPEISYLRYSKFYPHYLGPREKYLAIASILKTSGILNPSKIGFFQEIYEHRQEKYHLVDEFVFRIGTDGTLDPVLLKSIRDNGKKVMKQGEPNYLALLLPGVHYTV